MGYLLHVCQLVLFIVSRETPPRSAKFVKAQKAVVKVATLAVLFGIMWYWKTGKDPKMHLHCPNLWRKISEAKGTDKKAVEGPMETGI